MPLTSRNASSRGGPEAGNDRPCAGPNRSRPRGTCTDRVMAARIGIVGRVVAPVEEAPVVEVVPAVEEGPVIGVAMDAVAAETMIAAAIDMRSAETAAVIDRRRAEAATMECAETAA